MSLTRVYAIFLRQVFLIRSNPTRLATLFLWVIVDTIQWGYISQYLGSLGQSTFSFVTVILGAIILWEFVTRTQHGLMRGFLEDIWTQNFINYFASPLEIREYLAGLVITSIATSLIGFWIMVGIAGLAFGYNLFRIGLFLLPFVSILFVFGIAMGIFRLCHHLSARPVRRVARLAGSVDSFHFFRRLLSYFDAAAGPSNRRQIDAALLCL